MRLGLEIASSRGLTDGPLVRSFEVIEKGLRVWLAMRQMKAVIIEFLDDSGKCVEVFELPIEYDAVRDGDEHFDTQISSLKDELTKLRAPTATSYRFIIVNPKTRVSVPGWKPCERSDTSKLKKRQLLQRLISTGDIKVHVYVYEGEDNNEA